MTEPTNNEAVAATVQDSTAPARPSHRRKRSEDVVEPESPVKRPSNVVFQASPTSIAGVLAKTGVGSESTLSWSRTGEQADAAAGAPTALRMEAPVFIIGAGRELLSNVLGTHPNLNVEPETTVLAEMTKSIETNRDRLAHKGYPEQYWYKKVADEFSGLQADRAGQANQGRWVQILDTASIPLSTLDRMFPTSRIVNVVADGLSRLGARGTRSSAARLAAGRYLEVRASDLKTNPDGVRRQVLEFLGE